MTEIRPIEGLYALWGELELLHPGGGRGATASTREGAAAVNAPSPDGKAGEPAYGSRCEGKGRRRRVLFRRPCAQHSFSASLAGARSEVGNHRPERTTERADVAAGREGSIEGETRVLRIGGRVTAGSRSQVPPRFERRGCGR